MKPGEFYQGALNSTENKPHFARDAALLGLAIFAWALFGIFTRGSNPLASFWPANAFLLAMLVRFPELAKPVVWPAAFLGFIAADILTGSTLLKAGLLTLANLAGAAVGYAILSRLDEDDRQLRRPLAVLRLVFVLAAASAASGLVGAVANPVLFGGNMLGGFGWWFITELVNFVAIVPVILTIPKHSWLPGDRRRLWLPSVEPLKLLPIAMLLLSALASVLVGGPGAIAFPVPALLWCAASYGLLVTSILVLSFSAWTLLGIAIGLMQVPLDGAMSTVSARLGVMLIALAPLMVASVIEAHKSTVEQLRYLATHDDMTGLKNRVMFFELGRAALESANRARAPASVMMLDLDRFKFINDTYGHQAGDRILIAFAECLRGCLREDDICGRIGGEEFAAVLPNCHSGDAEAVARRILGVFSVMRIDLAETSIRATVSIGIASSESGEDFEALLSNADKALYLAKQNGRNRVELLPAASA